MGTTKCQTSKIKNLCLHFSYRYICIWTCALSSWDCWQRFWCICLWMAKLNCSSNFVFLEGKMPGVLIWAKNVFLMIQLNMHGNEKRNFPKRFEVLSLYFNGCFVLYPKMKKRLQGETLNLDQQFLSISLICVWVIVANFSIHFWRAHLISFQKMYSSYMSTNDSRYRRAFNKLRMVKSMDTLQFGVSGMIAQSSVRFL